MYILRYSMCLCMYIRMYVCMYVCKCIYTHTHTQEHASYGAYVLPTLFGEDFLNSYYDILRSRLTATAGEAYREGEFAIGANSDPPPSRPDDYRFCYMGPRGTWTPLHRDVLRSVFVLLYQ